jgi:membrane protease YdiL (CAAX protease family)
MMQPSRASSPIRSAARRHQILAFLLPVFAVSALALVLVGPPQLGSGPSETLWVAFAFFPVMILTVAGSGIGLTALVDGRPGLRELAARLRHVRIRPAWYLLLLVPPFLVIGVLLVLETAVSPAFAPGFLAFGVAFGLPAGLLEEIGWSGYLYPRMRRRFGPTAGALVLGVVWGVWHLPVVDALGAASPHRSAWPLFFLAFVAAMTGLRLLIARAYDATGSLPLAQLLHASSTASLVTFGAAAVSPAQEALWYAGYAFVLWAVAIGVIWLTRRIASRVGGRPDLASRAAG